MLNKINIKAIFILSLSAFFGTASIFGAEKFSLNRKNIDLERELALHKDRLHRIEQYCWADASELFPKEKWSVRIGMIASAAKMHSNSVYINLAIGSGELEKSLWDYEQELLSRIQKFADNGEVDEILPIVYSSKIATTRANVLSEKEWKVMLKAE